MNNKVHWIDNMEFMRGCKDNEFDLAIPDPWYGINADSMNLGFSNSSKIHKKTGDKNPPNEKYFNELFRISKNQIICGMNYFLKFLPSCKGFIVWDKGPGMYGRSFAECELVWHSFDENARIFKYAPNYMKKIHKCQKPVALYKWLLKNYAKPGDIIFDSHVGSGSIRIACHDMGFDFVGCEIDPDYWQAQEARYQEHIKNQELFGTDEYQEIIYDQGKLIEK